MYNVDDTRPLRGKTALVTGSSGGIGAGIAKVFAAAGADIIVHYNSRKEGAISTFKSINERYDNAATNGDINLPGRCLGIIQADFRDASAIDEMFECVLNYSLPNNRLDILVNNAGIVTKLALEDDDKLSSWHETMAVNLHAPLQLMKLAHKHMKSTTIGSRRGGVIINNTSIHGSRSVEFMTAYAASKAALDSLTRGLACEFAEDGVRVNAIAPGVVPVERTEQAFADPKVTGMWLPHLPVGRLGTVEDITHATLLLAVNEWMTGNILTVDGGMMARANMPIRPKPPKQATPVDKKNVSNASRVTFEVPP
jgi:glucose 1-dehydrogenase